jgi:hypothetical protein
VIVINPEILTTKGAEHGNFSFGDTLLVGCSLGDLSKVRLEYRPSIDYFIDTLQQALNIG